MISKLKKIFVSGLLIFSSSFTLCAQKNIFLVNEKINLSPKDYFIAKIIDARKEKNNTGVIGKILTTNYSKENLILSGGVENAISTYLRANLLGSASNASGIILKINQLSINETKRIDGKIDGKANLSVTFEKIVADDTLKIATAEANNIFVRSLINAGNKDRYEQIIRQLLTANLTYLTNWLAKNAGKSAAFVKKSQVTLLPDFIKNDEDTLSFSVRKLNWTDFKGSIPVSKFAATVYPSIGYDASFMIKNGILEAVIRPKVFVVRSISWAKTESKTDYVLAHEQVHFTIAKIVLEHFKQKIQAINAETMDILNSRIQYEYLEAFREMNKMQEAYDNETNHGIYEDKQRFWAEKINKELGI